MAIITVSNIGGSFFDPAAWVGGVIPGLYDSIAFTSTSGNLEIDGYLTNNILGIDFTNFTGDFKMSGVASALNIENNGAISSFINFGTGGYTFTDASVGNNAAIQIFSNTDCIITNTVNKVNPFRLLFTRMSITGTWQQQGILYDGGGFLSTVINDGILHLLGTQNLTGWFNLSNASGGVSFNGAFTNTDMAIDGGIYKVLGGTFVCPIIDIVTTSTTRLDFNGYNFSTISFAGGPFSLFLDSILYGTVGNVSTAGSIVFDGAYGFDMDTFTNSATISPVITFKSLIEYKANTYIRLTRATISASTPGSKAKLTLGQNIDQFAIVDVTATDIDSSNGRRVNNFYGTATNCDNWKIWNDNTLPQVPSTF